ncbi:MAG TPA: nuclear transport factor 2 family protein [Bryobacteraceae bacterium]|nr:nuclear transport factor 2 family protein [Bryobacteraceae bacterium]
MNTDVATQIIALESAALERWGKGDPSGFLELTDPEVAYFDPFTEQRLDGLCALTDLYEGLRGQVLADRFELLNPRVQAAGAAAVLTFNYVSHTAGKEDRWNCTEVYRRTDEGVWKIIQTHWSLTAAVKA